MPTRKFIMGPFFQPRNQVIAPDHTPGQPHAQQDEPLKTKRKTLSSHTLTNHLYGMCTVIATTGLLSPLLVASLTFGAIPH
jgi:hypothetical protein